MGWHCSVAASGVEPSSARCLVSHPMPLPRRLRSSHSDQEHEGARKHSGEARSTAPPANASAGAASTLKQRWTQYCHSHPRTFLVPGRFLTPRVNIPDASVPVGISARAAHWFAWIAHRFMVLDSKQRRISTLYSFEGAPRSKAQST